MREALSGSERNRSPSPDLSLRRRKLPNPLRAPSLALAANFDGFDSKIFLRPGHQSNQKVTGGLRIARFRFTHIAHPLIVISALFFASLKVCPQASVRVRTSLLQLKGSAKTARIVWPVTALPG